MTDPSDALTSFQDALSDGQIRLQKGDLNPDLFVHTDRPQGVVRFTYVSLDRQNVAALAMFVIAEPIEGVPCFHVGYGVPERFRSQGRAKALVEAALSELKQGLLRNNVSSFYVEAIVGVDNEPSKRVALATISSTPDAVTDDVSGLPALQYLRKV
jgi:hypothetical protein